MGKSGVTLDKVVINIESDANRANQSISSLSSTLLKLKESIAGGFNNIKKLSESLSALKTASDGMGNTVTNLSKLDNVTKTLKELSTIQPPKGLQSVIRTLKKLGDEASKLETTATGVQSITKMLEPLQSLSQIGTPKGLTSITTALKKLGETAPQVDGIVAEMSKLPQLVQPLQSLSTIADPRGLSNAIRNLEKIPDVFAKITPDSLQNVARVSEQLADSLTPLANKLGDIGRGFSAMSMMADRYGVSTTKIREYSKKAITPMERLSAVAGTIATSFKRIIPAVSSMGKTTNRVFKKMWSQIKQVSLSLLGTRTLFTAVRKSISEYLQMDKQLADSISNVWRALGALMAPAVEEVIYWFKQFARVVYSVIKAITGFDLIARANARATAEWGKSTASLLGNLQKFDDLNVVEFPKATGGDLELIDLKEIDLTPIQWIVDLIRKIKDSLLEAFETGRWYGVGEALGEGINETLSHINTDTVRDKLKKVGKETAELFNGLILSTDFGKLSETFSGLFVGALLGLSQAINDFEWETLGKKWSDFISDLDVSGILNSLASIISGFVVGFSNALNNIEWNIVAIKLSEALRTAISNLSSFINELDFKKMGENIRNFIVNIDWVGVFKDVLGIFVSMLDSVGELLSGLFNTKIDGGQVAGITGAIIAVAMAIKAFNDVKPASVGNGMKKISEGLSKGFSSLGKASETIAVLGGIALVLSSLSNVFKTFGESGLTLSEGVGLVVTLLGSLTASIIGLSFAINAMSLDKTISLLTVVGSLAILLNTLSSAMTSLAEHGVSVGDVLGTMLIVLGSVVGLMTAVTILGPAMSVGLVPFLAIVGSIVLILGTMALTLPTILEACGQFINNVAPAIQTILTTIGDIINNIIHSLGDVLPPIIKSIGTMFKTIFDGIAKTIDTVGNTLVRILTTVKDLIKSVLTSSLDFINRLGPAINNFIDNAILAVTKLINFIVSSVEYLINSAIIGPINKLIKTINNNAIAEKLGWQLSKLSTVSVPRFAPKLETGTNNIEYEGLYHLHEGEAVVPKKYNPAMGGGTNEETNAKLDTLITLLSNIEMTNIVNIGNERVYKAQQKFNKQQENKYGTINIY